MINTPPFLSEKGFRRVSGEPSLPSFDFCGLPVFVPGVLVGPTL